MTTDALPITAALPKEIASELFGRLHETPIVPARVAAFLDGLSHERRLAAVRSLGMREQRRLWHAVDGFAPVYIRELVPKSVPDMATVRHHGKNSLLMHTLFEKRMCRPTGSDPSAPAALYGFNFQTWAGLTGPGHFVAVDDPERPEVLIDYRRLPDVVPPNWPGVQSNERGVARFVYGFMVDRLRRVSEHVTIGRANRHGRDMAAWFMLCREPAQP